MKKLLCGVAAAALLLAGCTNMDDEVETNGSAAPAAGVAAEPSPAVSTPAMPATAAAKLIDADPALWLVKDGDTNIYLFGTIHFLKPGYSWFDEAVKAAYDRSSEVVLEINTPDPATAQAVSMRYMTSSNGTLTSKLSPALKTKYEAGLAKLGVPAAALDSFDPWAAALTVGLIPYLKAGFTPESGAEAVITAAAKASGKSLAQLETMDQQFGWFESMPLAQQLAFLDGSLDQIDGATASIDMLFDSWAKGDPDRLGNLMNEAMRATPELAKLLLADRNAKWAEWIDNRLDRPGNVFVAVGAGHLAGNDSVQKMLAKRTLTATRVRY